MRGFGFGGGGMGLFGAIFGGLLCLAVVALIVLLIVWAVRGIRHSGRMGMMHMGHFEDPLAIVKARYAKGEITEKEYKKLVSDLKD